MSSKHKLGELASTAICGNDISSSVLYVSALAIGFAGQYAWITLLIVGAVLFFFRKIYGEVVGALPLNGGAYNALLNTTSKGTASLAATLTLLSYMATAVISGNEAMHYLFSMFPEAWFITSAQIADLMAQFPVHEEFLKAKSEMIHHNQNPFIIGATTGLLLIFLCLTIMGISESAFVAIGIFIFHLVSLVVLTIAIGIYVAMNGLDLFSLNMSTPMNGSLTMAIFFGFAASMLGISGFESSANFVEEQKKGVFPKTLRNMWIIVSIFNPLMVILALCTIPIGEIQSEHSTTLLSHMGEVSAGKWLATIISIDAVLVLSGAVLTSYVGVSGLMERMSLDRILPQFFLRKNKRGSAHWILITFFALSVSVLLITMGKVTLLAGVYTISFLSVMLLFGFGNMLLKIKREKLPRPERSSWMGLLIAIVAVTIALVGNVVMQPKEEGMPSNTRIFLTYFIPAILFIGFMLKRVVILTAIMKIFRYIFTHVKDWFLNVTNGLNKTIDTINSQQFVYFTKSDNIAMLNKVMLYIKQNEDTKRLKLVHVVEKENENKHRHVEEFHEIVRIIDVEYPEIDVESIIVEGEFCPSLIMDLSKKWNIPANFMFISSPGDKFPYRIEELSGVRLII